MKPMNHYKKLRLLAEIEEPKDAAGKLECSLRMVHAIEKGDRHPGRKLAEKMCELYNCTMDDIYRPGAKKRKVKSVAGKQSEV